MPEVISHKDQQLIKKSVGEILVERQGLLETPEIYSNKTEFLVMFLNKYSILIKATRSRKKVSAFIYKGVVDVSESILGAKDNAVRADSVEALFNRVATLKEE